VSDAVRVLIVDDVDDAAQSLADLLELNGYQAQTARSGPQALELARTFAPHCVLLDIAMPGMDGLQLAQRLREDHGNDIVLIAVTGGSTEQSTVAATFAVVDHYLMKPVDVERLNKVLPKLSE